jgi:hypothetical protein
MNKPKGKKTTIRRYLVVMLNVVAPLFIPQKSTPADFYDTQPVP